MSYEIDPTYTALMAAILDNPAEDTPRLMLADWIEDHDRFRAEFIRGQIQGGPEFGTRGNNLIKANSHYWECGIATPSISTEYTRGFVSALRLPFSYWKSYASRLANAFPIERITFSDATAIQIDIRRNETGWRARFSIANPAIRSWPVSIQGVNLQPHTMNTGIVVPWELLEDAAFPVPFGPVFEQRMIDLNIKPWIFVHDSASRFRNWLGPRTGEAAQYLVDDAARRNPATFEEFTRHFPDAFPAGCVAKLLP